ncbi:unnamed protein product [Oppiella nova]|uniref:Nose resistant-to-fluoxetine protein N-terminal domain-containing protein n=1 Tax=Oppiella nova TaxID=334625 RepID=A0A7R9MFV6_9ACAR|nr:unnamed protein product [Oppiella nova]CAG2176478.1 unnamed protein product [Oppiella nova]
MYHSQANYSSDETNTSPSTNLTDSESDDNHEDDRCSEDEIIEKFIEILTPEDYSEGKDKIKYTKNSFTEQMAAMSRLGVYGQNVSRKTEGFNKRISNRMSEAFMSINLEPSCMRSLMRIQSAGKNGELWALKFSIFDAQPSFQMTVFELGGPSLGNYDQCLSIESPPEEDDPGDIKDYNSMENIVNSSEASKNLMYGMFGSYVPIVISRGNKHNSDISLEFLPYGLKKDTKIINGYCLPTTCKPEDLSDALNEIPCCINFRQLYYTQLPEFRLNF